MAVSFNNILAEVMSQLNALTAVSVSGAEASYAAAAGGTLGANDQQSTDWPLSQIKEAVIDAEYTLAYELCGNDFHPQRVDFHATSAGIQTSGPLPTMSAGGVPYIGKFSYVTDTVYQYTERPFQVVKWVSENDNAMFNLATPRIFAIYGGQIFVPGNVTVYIVGPALSRATFTGNIRVRDHHRPAIVSGALARLLAKEGAWQEAYGDQLAQWNGFMEQIRGVGRYFAAPYPSQT